MREEIRKRLKIGTKQMVERECLRVSDFIIKLRTVQKGKQCQRNKDEAPPKPVLTKNIEDMLVQSNREK